ncbi:Protein pim1 [Escovopsis weberi]|uniref:Protein pim1 n=1 Tax=Escovopsis weberi TaxID=150374 RepID=A0A0M9VUG2_ESCWE|nr:Protein pim1 [Escovopsis weberi]
MPPKASKPAAKAAAPKAKAAAAAAAADTKTSTKKAATSKAATTKAPAKKAEKADKAAKAVKAVKPEKAPRAKAAAKAAATGKGDKQKEEKGPAAADQGGKEVKADKEGKGADEDKAPAEEKPAAGAQKKRKAEETETEEDREAQEKAPKPKKNKTEAAPARAPAKPKKAPVNADIGKKVNDAPTQVKDVYVFGEGTSGELGLGSKKSGGKKPIDVKRPRLNENLSAKAVGVVQIACGGMHALALTRDNKILSWGVNDQGALGRDTNWDGGLRDAANEDSDSDDDDDTGMNPLESTPTAIAAEHFIPGTVFVQLVASDSASFVLTEDGRVYGWGTFRSSDGILGFTETIKVQTKPMLLPTLKNIKALSAGANHILALDHKGNVVAWGCGQQNQLGRRIIERNKMSSLVPQGVGLPRNKIAQVACGAYHSFAIDKSGTVWGWGLNNFGEIGVDVNAGEDDAVILKPVKLNFLEGHSVSEIAGGMHHSLACTDKGELFTWGRVDGFQVGFEQEQIEKIDKDYIIRDERGSARILVKPTKHENLADVVAISAGVDNSFAVTKQGKAYSWGFSTNYQTGQGTIEDIHVPTHIDNSAIREKKIVAAYAGGQFSVLIGVPEDVPMVNGVDVNGTD